jgi:hypothetical protein
MPRAAPQVREVRRRGEARAPAAAVVRPHRGRAAREERAVTTDEANDLLSAFADALDGARAPLAFAVEHAPDGVDPVPRAWAAADDRRFLVAVAQRLDPRSLYWYHGSSCFRCHHPVFGVGRTSRCADCADVLRAGFAERTVGRTPSLSDLTRRGTS